MSKRFYDRAQAAAAAGGHTVTLDGRRIRTPAKADLIVPTAALAGAIAAEWEAQGATIDRHSMPQMHLACTAIDDVSANVDGVVQALLAYAETDLLYYRANGPASLVERQGREWQPVLDWAGARYQVQFAVTSGVVPVAQPPETLARLRLRLAKLDHFTLTGLQSMVGTLGSLILALAVLESRIRGAQAFALSQLDEQHQAERWGKDEEAEARRAAMLTDIEASEAFLRALQT